VTSLPSGTPVSARTFDIAALVYAERRTDPAQARDPLC
jgi:hypothetical protein